MSMLLGLLLSCHYTVLALGGQHLLEAPVPRIPHNSGIGIDNSTSPFVFNSLSGLLTQWSNTVHGTGHSIVPGYLAPFTVLYHAREDSLRPPSPEWLAWDPQMSLGLMLPRGGETYLLTYRATRPARILYFDGMSAARGPGWLDSQHMFIFGMSPNGSKDIAWWDDYGRAAKLCDWATSRHVEGFVRMNAGFELLWCNFTSPSIQLINHLNVTPPGTPSRGRTFPGPPRRALVPVDLDLTSYEEHGNSSESPPQRAPGQGGPPRWFPRISPLAMTSALEWVRAASHRSFSPQPYLTLSYADMISYYHPRFTSLIPDRVGRTMRTHRLTNVSSADAQSLVQEVEAVLLRNLPGSGVDWGATARRIVEYWGDRISHMQTYLVNASDPSANATEAIPAIRTLAYALLIPYMQSGLTPNASGWDLFFSPVPHLENTFSYEENTTGLERCTYQATGFLTQLYASGMTPQETLLQTAVESVLARLCTDFGVLFAQSYDIEENSFDPRMMIKQWTHRIQALVQWLDWATWLRCEEVCPRDYVCSTPLWPMAWFRMPENKGHSNEDSELLNPRCMRMAL